MTVCKKDTYTIITQIFKAEKDAFPSISPPFTTNYVNIGVVT